MFSKSLFKQSCKANGIMWTIITVAVCFMLCCVMLISNSVSRTRHFSSALVSEERSTFKSFKTSACGEVSGRCSRSGHGVRGFRFGSPGEIPFGERRADNALLAGYSAGRSFSGAADSVMHEKARFRRSESELLLTLHRKEETHGKKESELSPPRGA